MCKQTINILIIPNKIKTVGFSNLITMNTNTIIFRTKTKIIVGILLC